MTLVTSHIAERRHLPRASAAQILAVSKENSGQPKPQLKHSEVQLVANEEGVGCAQRLEIEVL